MEGTVIKKRIKEGFEGQILMVLPPHIKRAVSSNPINRNMYLTAIGYYPRANYHYCERKSGSSQYILIYCTQGMGFIYVNSSRYKLKANDFFIIPSHTPHRYISSHEDPWSIYWVHFNGHLAQDIYERSLLNGRQIVRETSYSEGRISTFNEICAILKWSYGQREMEGMNFYLLHFITSLIYNKEADSAAYTAGLINGSITFMKDNINGKYGLSDLAAEQNVSVAQYARKFKQHTGSSPVNYFNQLKVQKASEYLNGTDRSIKSICQELGFEDQYYFSRLFKKINGVSPSKYKQINGAQINQ
jgi:AraC family transcriptional regulator of arabinose operon